MDMPRRKHLRLPEHDYSSPGAYFVTICTGNRRCILSSIPVGAGAPDSPLPNLTKLGKIVEEHILSTGSIPGFSVDKYVIMPNHIHMIVRIERPDPKTADEPPRGEAGRRGRRPLQKGNDPAATQRSPTLSDAVGALKCLVNRKAGENIWQRSYHEHVIRDENDYRAIWEYIDTNPMKWADDRYYAD